MTGWEDKVQSSVSPPGQCQEPDDVTEVEVMNESGEQIGFLMHWDAGCWMYAENSGLWAVIK
jgi:hypothetical protein